MSSLSSLPADVLARTEKACDHLTWLYETHNAIDRELYVKVSTLLADVHATTEDLITGQQPTAETGPPPRAAGVWLT